MKLKELIFLTKSLSRTNNRFLNFANKVALLSIIVGIISLMISLSILNGFDNALRTTARKFTSDICVKSINYSDLIDIEKKIKTLKSIKEINNVVPVIQTEAIVSTSNHTEGIVIQSLPINVADFSLNDKIISGNMGHNCSDKDGIIIGEELATKLNVKIGDKILIYAIKDKERITFSSATYSNFTINAIYRTGMTQYDNSLAFIPYNNIRKFLEKDPNTATYLEISLKNINNLKNLYYMDTICKQIDAMLGYPVFAISYYDINRSIFAWIELQKEPIPIVLAIISIVAAMNTITMLIITIVEKTNSIGILRTLGLTKGDIMKLFVYLSIRLAIIGLIIGMILSITFIFIQKYLLIIKLDSKIYFIDSLPVDINWQHIIIVGILTLFFSFIASLVPSFIAVKISPIKTIRFK